MEKFFSETKIYRELLAHKSIIDAELAPLYAHRRRHYWFTNIVGIVALLIAVPFLFGAINSQSIVGAVPAMIILFAYGVYYERFSAYKKMRKCEDALVGWLGNQIRLLDDVLSVRAYVVQRELSELWYQLFIDFPNTVLPAEDVFLEKIAMTMSQSSSTMALKTASAKEPRQ